MHKDTQSDNCLCRNLKKVLFLCPLIDIPLKDKITLFDIQIDNLSMDETIAYIDNAIKKGEHIHHEGVNASKLVDMQSDKILADSVNNADMINGDGQSVIWASKILGKPLKERVAGIDQMQRLVALAHQRGYSIFLFGAKEEVVKTVVDNYSKKYGSELIAGYRNGYFSKDDELAIAKQIADSGAQMLFVGISSPTKEIFVNTHRDILKNINLVMGVGGSFDVISGKVKRAPKWMQNIGMEWFYRFLQEPKRMWKRYLVGNSKFIWMVIKEKIAN